MNLFLGFHFLDLDDSLVDDFDDSSLDEYDDTFKEKDLDEPDDGYLDDIEDSDVEEHDDSSEEDLETCDGDIPPLLALEHSRALLAEG